MDCCILIISFVFRSWQASCQKITLCCLERNLHRSADVLELHSSLKNKTSLTDQRYKKSLATARWNFISFICCINVTDVLRLETYNVVSLCYNLFKGLRALFSRFWVGTSDEDLWSCVQALPRRSPEQGCQEKPVAAVQNRGEESQEASRKGLPVATGAWPIITTPCFQSYTRW